MNYLFIVSFGFAFIAMLRLSHKIEAQLDQIAEAREIKVYRFIREEKRVYRVIPCPTNYEILSKLSNVIWIEVDPDSSSLLIEAETQECITDLITALNSCR